jgi:hypothetical protein
MMVLGNVMLLLVLEDPVLLPEVVVLGREGPVCALELGVLALKSLLLVLERGEVFQFIIEETADFEFIIEFPARRLASVGIRRWVLRSGSFRVAMVAVVVVVVTVMTNLELICVLPARRGTVGIRRWVLRGGSFRVAMVVVVVVMTAAMNTCTTFSYGLSKDRRDGSSSKNECDGKFDLNHF